MAGEEEEEEDKEEANVRLSPQDLGASAFPLLGRATVAKSQIFSFLLLLLEQPRIEEREQQISQFGRNTRTHALLLLSCT